jgi:oxalate decarboxylase/phosphoglucose isomerase-like protein (cupin superfamily)
MTRLFQLAVAAVFTLVALAPADEKKASPAITNLANDKADKIDTEGGKPTEPKVVSSEEDLKKAIPDDDTRKRVGKLVDFKEQKLLVFAWKGSGGDKLAYTVAESYPEQITFTVTAGKTDDLRSHVHLFAVRKNVKWAVK